MKKVVQFDSEEEKVMVVFTVVARLVVMLECFPEEILGRLADDCIVDLNDPNSWMENGAFCTPINVHHMKEIYVAACKKRDFMKAHEILCRSLALLLAGVMSPFPVLKEVGGDLDRYKLLLMRHEKYAEADSLLQYVDEIRWSDLDHVRRADFYEDCRMARDIDTERWIDFSDAAVKHLLNKNRRLTQKQILSMKEKHVLDAS